MSPGANTKPPRAPQPITRGSAKPSAAPTPAPIAPPVFEEEEDSIEIQGADEDSLHGGDDDDLPPAAIAEPTGSDEDTAVQLPVMDIDEYRILRLDDEDDDRPSWLRRAWRWFWDWLRR